MYIMYHKKCIQSLDSASFCSIGFMWIMQLKKTTSKAIAWNINKHFINKPDSSRDLTIFMILFIFSLEIINFLIPGPNISLWIAASVAAADAVDPNAIKKLLANGLSTFFIKGNPVLSNGPKNVPTNPRD